MRGYVEVRSTLPAKVDGGNMRGAWPAIWMLGTGNGHDWPTHGEIDIVEAVNGDPKVTSHPGLCLIIVKFVVDLHDNPLHQLLRSQWSASRHLFLLSQI